MYIRLEHLRISKQRQVVLLNKIEKYYNFTEFIHSLEAKRRSATEEIPPFMEYEGSLQYSHEPATGHWPRINLVLFLTPHLFKIHFNINIAFTCKSQK
jgi:hypothetical protein